MEAVQHPRGKLIDAEWACKEIQDLREALNFLVSDHDKGTESSPETWEHARKALNDIYQDGKWTWMMDYCKQHGLAPANGWDQAAKAWEERNAR